MWTHFRTFIWTFESSGEVFLVRTDCADQRSRLRKLWKQCVKNFKHELTKKKKKKKDVNFVSINYSHLVLLPPSSSPVPRCKSAHLDAPHVALSWLMKQQLKAAAGRATAAWEKRVRKSEKNKCRHGGFRRAAGDFERRVKLFPLEW